MKYKTSLKYLFYLLLIGGLLIIGSVLLENHYSQAQRSFEYNPLYITVVIVIFFGGIGGVLGIGHNNVIFKKSKRIRIDISKLLLLGLPSFIISMTYIWMYVGLISENIISLSFLLVNDHIIKISSVIFGHTLISSINIDQN